MVYIFAIARQCGLETEDSLGWGTWNWTGGLSEKHDLAVIDLLTPGAEVPAGPGGRRRGLEEGFNAGDRLGGTPGAAGQHRDREREDQECTSQSEPLLRRK